MIGILKSHTNNDPLSNLSDQRAVLQPKNKNSEVNDPFAYLENVKVSIASKKRIGQFNKLIGLEEIAESLLFERSANFITDERVFANHTIEKQYINPTALNKRLPYHDIDSQGQKVNREIHQPEVTIDTLGEIDDFEKAWLLKDHDDQSGAPMPNVHKKILKKGKTAI